MSLKVGSLFKFFLSSFEYVKVGKFYKVKDSPLFLYSTKDAALLTIYDGMTMDDGRILWSRQYKTHISVLVKNSAFRILEKDQNCLKIVTNNGEVGWVISPYNEAWKKSWIEEVKNQ